MPDNHQQFLAHHPYLTYSDRKNFCFVDPSGKSLGKPDWNAQNLFRIGRQAYELSVRQVPNLEEVDWERNVLSSREGFDLVYENHLESVACIREAFLNKSRNAEKPFKLLDERGNSITHRLSELSDFSVMEGARQFLTSSARRMQWNDEGTVALRGLLEHSFPFIALKLIDDALLGLRYGGNAVADAVMATMALAYASSIRLEDKQHSDARVRLAQFAVSEKIKHDPKQMEKRFVLECWVRWQQGDSEYSGKAAFARDMLTKCEHLKSQKKIEDWCREWEKK